jgi:hypothetical protein
VLWFVLWRNSNAENKCEKLMESKDQRVKKKRKSGASAPVNLDAVQATARALQLLFFNVARSLT